MYTIDFSKPCKVYFIGIGGISMSGLAEILVKENFDVLGSDMKASDMTNSLETLGIKVNIGQVSSNIDDDIKFIIYTAAIKPDNPEFQEAKKKHIPMLTRAELLGQIMKHYKYSVAVSGTHGKTTTTSMLTHILLSADMDPTITIGGMLDAINGNIRVGQSDYFVTEACEYTNSYHSLTPYISIILNVDADHLDFFSGIEEIIESFKIFAEKIPDNGLLVINGDMPCRDRITSSLKCKVITFGFGAENDYSASDIIYDEEGRPTYTLIRANKENQVINIHSTGKHNVMNSLSAIAVADFLGIDLCYIKKGLLSCTSAKRRFEKKGVTSNGVIILDDYAHHPTEIAATLATAKNTRHNELWCVFQPHTYSRTKALLNEFAIALSVCDHVILADIYAAREKDTGEISSQILADLINQKGGHALYLSSFDEIEKYAEKNCKKNDLLITMGAGNIDTVGNILLKK